MNPLDEIRLTGLRAIGHHGVMQHERALGQLFVIDVALVVSLAEAGRTDDLTTTVHYGELAEAIVGAVQRDPVDLIETVAHRIADVVLADARISSVTVTVHKPNAPITVPFDDVSVTIRRAQPTA